jgi:hypothetical protein
MFFWSCACFRERDGHRLHMISPHNPPVDWCMRRARAIMLLVLTLPAPLFSGLAFSVDKPEIQAGESTVIRWNAPDSSAVFISSLGKVSTSGYSAVTLNHNTTYVLVAEGRSGVAIRQIGVIVQGARAVDYPIDFNTFRHPLRLSARSKSVVALLDQIQHVLQNDFRLSVNGPFPLAAGHVSLITDYADLNALPCPPKEVHLGHRRISYMVDIAGEPSGVGPYQLTLTAFYQYQKELESTWRDGNCASIYQDSTASLKTRLEQISP